MAADKSEKHEARKKDAGAEADERIEWWIGIASAAATLALIGYLLFEALTGTGNGPLLSVVQREVREVADRYILELEVRNEGDETATEVVVEGRLGTGEDLEVSSVTLDYVPPGPGTPAALIFDREPVVDAVVLSIRGYRYP
jgi:uncharacterized protein (TIGR02588 family)